MPKRIKWLLFAVSLWSLSSCAPKPPDVFVFENLAQHLATDPATRHLVLTASPTCVKQIGEFECGHGVAIVSGKEIFVGENPSHLFNGKPWSKIKQEAVYLPAEESYAPLAAYIINACEKMNCGDNVNLFRVKLDSLKIVSKP